MNKNAISAQFSQNIASYNFVYYISLFFLQGASIFEKLEALANVIYF